MKLILLGDLHVGASGDDALIQKIQIDLLEQMCDYAKANGIKTMIQSGDWFDIRVGPTQNTLNLQREKIHPLLADAFDDVYAIVGNHDSHYKNTIHPNTPVEVLTDKLYHVIQYPTTVAFGSTQWDLIPWMCKDNRDDILEFIKNSSSEYNVGHWELDGYEFYAGIKSSGEDAEFLSDYKKVYSGHYHTSSERGNVLYIGTPYTLTMGDANETRGFWVFDTETETAEFVANKNCWHYSIRYNDEFDPSIIDRVAGKFVRMLIEKSDKKLEGTLSQLEERCYSFTEKYIEDLSVSDADDGVKTRKIVDVINDHISSLALDEAEKELIRTLITGTYNEAIAGVR